MIAITLFKIKDNLIKDNYISWSLSFVRPKMIKMNSVKGFMDYSVVGSLNYSGIKYDFIEIIEITNKEDFEEDNSKGMGLKLANEWNSWVDDYSIIYCEDINLIK